MRLSRLAIRRFKGIDEVELVMPRTAPDRPGSAEFLSLVGENNTGKSSVLEALSLACPGQDLTSPTIDHFPRRDPEPKSPVEVELEFDELTPADKEKQASRAHIHAGKYRIKKTWEKPGAKYEGWAYYPEYSFPSLPEKTTREAYMTAGAGWEQLVEQYETEHGKITRFGAKAVQELKHYAIKHGAPVAVKGEPAWSKNPGGIAPNLDSILPRVIFVHAVRETKEEVATARAKSTIRQIVNVLFERYLSSSPAVHRFRTAAEAVQKLFEGQEKDRFVARLEQQLTAKLSRLIDVRALLDFELPDVAGDLAAKTRLLTEDSGYPIAPENQGNGAQRAIILTLLEHLAEQRKAEEAGTYERPLLLLIEEPEIYLHPQMCRKMRDVLLDIARSGTAQVICTTHSPVFLDLADRHDGIAIFSRGSDGRIHTHQRTDDLFAGDSPKQARARLRMVMNFDPSANEVFFARRVCLVEGDCEIAALEAAADQLSRKGELDFGRYLLQRRELALLNCHGKWTIPAFQHVLKAFRIDYSVVHDHDDGTPAEDANAAILNVLDGDETRRLVHHPNFEKQIFGEEWTRDKPWRAVATIREMDTLPDDLRVFFEFALGARIEDLVAPVSLGLSARELDRPVAGSTERLPRLRRTDLRCSLDTLSISNGHLSSASVGPGVITLPAGPCRIPELAEQALFQDGEHLDRRVVAEVRGSSMADTLADGDRVVLEALDNVYLEPIEGDRPPLPLAVFRTQIMSNGIYVIAMNDDVNDGTYTLKRVRFEQHGVEDWFCFIIADNPEADWGDRGVLVVRDTDRVHFAARLIGLVQDGAAEA